MKKILYKTYLQRKNDDEGRKIKGTGCWSDCPTYTIAIVVGADGLVHELHTNRIKFINLPG